MKTLPGNHNPLLKGLSRYLTAEQLAALQKTKVGIAGVGGLGSNVALMLARSGIQQFTLVDFDLVESSNLNRQFFFPDQIGYPKVEALAEPLLRLNPDLQLTLIAKRLTSDNIREIFSDCQVIVEALDQADNKAMCYRAFKNSGFLYIGASGLAGWQTRPMSYRHLNSKTILVGDFTSGVSEAQPPMAPRAIQAAAMQANAVLAYVLGENTPSNCLTDLFYRCS